MRLAVLVAVTMLPVAARAEGLLDGVAGTWAIGSAAACARSAYEWSVLLSGGGPSILFRDRTGRVNRERVDAHRSDGFTTTTTASPDVPAGTRWDYAAAGEGVFIVRNLSNGRQFALVRCAGAAVQPAAGQAAMRMAPTFSDPVALVRWLIENSTHGFSIGDDAANANVASPGLRTALRESIRRAGQRGEVGCLNADPIVGAQDEVTVRNLRLSAQATGPDRVKVTASFDASGTANSAQFLTVNLDGNWKLENIVGAGGFSLRRLLACDR